MIAFAFFLFVFGWNFYSGSFYIIKIFQFFGIETDKKREIEKYIRKELIYKIYKNLFYYENSLMCINISIYKKHTLNSFVVTGRHENMNKLLYLKKKRKETRKKISRLIVSNCCVQLYINKFSTKQINNRVDKIRFKKKML